MDLDYNSLVKAINEILKDQPEDSPTYKAFKNLEEQIKRTHDEAVKAARDSSTSLKNLSDMKSGIGTITSAYDEKKDSNYNTVSASTLNSMYDTLGVSEWDEANQKAWENYINYAANSKATMKELKQAQDELATAYVNSRGFLEGLTRETEESYKATLKEMGVKNADEVVTQTLARKEEELRLQKVLSTYASTDLQNATAGDINKLIELGLISETEAQKLALLTLKKQICNQNVITTAADCENIMQLVKATGAGVEAITKLELLKQRLSSNKVLSKTEIANINSSIKNIENNAIETANKNLNTTTQITTTGGNNYNGSGGSGDNPKDKEDSKQEIDWMERRLERFRSIIDLTKSKLENLFSVKKKNSNLDTQIKYITKLIKESGKAADIYKKKANSVKLSKELKKKVRNGDYSITEYDSDTADKINEYKDWYDKYWEQKKNQVEEKTEKRSLKKEKYQNLLDREDAKIQRVDAQVQNAVSVKKKNKYLNEQRKYIKDSYAYQIKIANLEKDGVKVDELKAKRKKDLRDNTISRYQNFADKADSKIDLYEAQKTNAADYKSKNGFIDKEKKQLEESYKWQIKIAKKEGDTLKVERLRAEFQTELADKTKEQFDNIDEYYNRIISLNNNKINAFQDQLSLLEAKGTRIGSELYARQMMINNENMDRLTSEREEQIKKLAEIEFGTDKWYEAQEAIYTTESEMVNMQIENANLQNSINQLSFDRFDDLLAKLNDIVDETDFLIDMLDSDNFYDDDGNITADGITAIGLNKQKYDVYLAEAEKYKDEIKKLDQMYANGNIGFDMYQEKLREYKSGQIDMVKSANDAKKAVIDLVKNGLDAQNEALEEAVNKQKELLESEKDLKEFQDTLAGQNKTITDLQKEINALEGDNSEENRKRLKEKKAALADAQKEQEDTLYDRSISDQKKALDKIVEDAKKTSEEYLKDSERVFTDAVSNVESNTEVVSNNIKRLSRETGYDISEYITNAWKQSGEAVNGFGEIIVMNAPGITSQIKIITDEMTKLADETERANKALSDATVGTYSQHDTTGSQDNNKEDSMSIIQNAMNSAMYKVIEEKDSPLTQVTQEQMKSFMDSVSYVPFAQPFANALKSATSSLVGKQQASNTINITTNVSGVATDTIVKNLENIATKQAENVVSKINGISYANGVRKR